MQLAHTPLGARGSRQPCWREGASRTLEATTARSRGCRNAWLPRPRAAWCGRAKQRAKQAIGLDEGIGIGIGIGRSPARGSLNLSPPLALTYRQLLEQPRDETSVKQESICDESIYVAILRVPLSSEPLIDACPIYMSHVEPGTQFSIANWAPFPRWFLRAPDAPLIIHV